MNKFIILFLLFTIIGCSEDTVNEEVFTNSNTEKDIQMKWRVGDPNLYVFDYEGALKWVSWLVTDCIINDLALRQYVLNKVDHTKRTVNLDDLLNGEQSGPLRAKFSQLLYDRQIAKPDNWDKFPINCITCKNNSTPESDSYIIPIGDRYVQYSDINYFLNTEHCTEIYLPNLIDFTNADAIYSTTHPLNNNQSNEATQHVITYNTYLSTFENLDYYDSYADYTSLTNGAYLLIVRPLRSTTISNCSYSHINVSDFTNFLDHSLYIPPGGENGNGPGLNDNTTD